MHPYIVISGFNVAAYDIMQGLGFILAASYCLIAGLGLGIKRSQLVIVILIGFFVQFFGGMAIPLIYKNFILHTPATLQFWKSCPGRYFHSSFLSIFIYAFCVARLLKWPVKKVMDGLTIAAMIMSPVGRIGCFLEGCCQGKPTNLPWAVRFPSAPSVGVHPAQIYMFFCELLILGALVWINKNKKYDGQTFWYGIFLYSVYRFFIEFLRTNPVFILGLTHAQFFSIVTLCISMVYILRDSRHKINQG